MITNKGVKTPVRILDVAFVPGFITNHVSLLILIDKGIF